MPPEASNPWPAERIGRVASIIQISTINLIEAEVTAIPEPVYLPEEYETFWRIMAFADNDAIDEIKGEEVVALNEGVSVIIGFKYTKEPDSKRTSADDQPIAEEDMKLLVAGTFLVRYTVIETEDDRTPLSHNDILAFANFNTIVNAWPYWREFVQSMTSRMEIPTVTVPLLPVPVVDL